ncbi:helix-turn-helix domain-containing protein [Methylocapsa sp. S129]|uniref:helix-turn-helix domain-containing protein n=1 Tax=Methylocapsa sp. S129 TaxID=1641869 RepID=UPI00352A4860
MRRLGYDQTGPHKVQVALDAASQFRTLRDVARLISSSGDLDLTLQQLVYAACQNPPWVMGSVMSIDQKNGHAQVMTRYDPTLLETRLEGRWNLATSPTLVALSRNEPVVIADAFLAKEFPGYRKEAVERGYHTVVVLPMGCADAEGRSMVLTVQSREVVAVGEEELTFLSSIVHLGVIAVEKSHRLRADRLLTERLQTALAVHSRLLSQVLSDGSVSSATAMISQLFPNPVIAIDFSASLIVAGRSPRPELYNDAAWQAAVRAGFGKQFMHAARFAIDVSREGPRDLFLDDGHKRLRITANIEPLSVDGEAVGALIMFPQSEILEELDHLMLESAKFALSVQMMRSYIRFQNETRTLTDLFKEIFDGRWRDAEDVAARARRLGIDPSLAARLITISSTGDAQAKQGLSIDAHRSVARIVQHHHEDGRVVTLGDTIICHAPPRQPGRTDRSDPLIRSILDEAVRIFGEEPILVEVGLRGGLDDYPVAWVRCQRIVSLARRFGRRGALTAQDFGPFPQLLAAADTSEVKLFVESSVGAMVRHDAKRGTAYLETLSKYLGTGCRGQACADVMGLHVTTLRYRLARVRELFGIEFGTQEQRFSLELAIRLYASLSGSSPLARSLRR